MYPSAGQHSFSYFACWVSAKKNVLGMKNSVQEEDFIYTDKK